MVSEKCNPFEEGQLDLMLINPSLDFKQDRKIIDSLRVNQEIPRQMAAQIGIGYLLAAAKKENLKAEFIDMVAYETSVNSLLDYIEEKKPSVVGFSAFTVQVKSAGNIADKIKDRFPEIKIGLGGPHATAMPKETLDEFKGFDFVVCGEGEKIIPQLLNSKLSEIKGVITRGKKDLSYDRIQNLDELAFPAWEKFDLSRYPGADPHGTNQELLLSTSRGCANNCVFCARPYGKNRIYRSNESILGELERNIKDFGCEAVNFCDETFTANIEYSSELFNEFIKRGLNKKIRWSCETRVDTATPELFKLMKTAGCYYIFFGFESGDDDMLKKAGKGFNVERIKKSIGWAKDADIVCAGSFILGLPGETEETARKSIELAKELDIYSTTFPIAVPFPGTVMRKMAERGQSGLKILTNNWDDYGKQYPGVMESNTLSINRLRELQNIAYTYNPKKEFPTSLLTKLGQ